MRASTKWCGRAVACAVLIGSGCGVGMGSLGASDGAKRDLAPAPEDSPILGPQPTTEVDVVPSGADGAVVPMPLDPGTGVSPSPANGAGGGNPPTGGSSPGLSPNVIAVPVAPGVSVAIPTTTVPMWATVPTIFGYCSAADRFLTAGRGIAAFMVNASPDTVQVQEQVKLLRTAIDDLQRQPDFPSDFRSALDPAGIAQLEGAIGLAASAEDTTGALDAIIENNRPTLDKLLSSFASTCPGMSNGDSMLPGQGVSIGSTI